MYESPIDISYSDMILKTMDEMSKKWNQESDNHVMACVNQFVKVDKDELIRALQYDRDQYYKGYEDGKRDAMKWWISVKERLPQDEQWVAALLYGLVGYNTILLQYNAVLNEFITDDGIEYDIDDVAYWVGLPEPPEVEGEEE